MNTLMSAVIRVPLASLAFYCAVLVGVGLWPFDFQTRCSDCPNGAVMDPGQPGISFPAEGMVLDEAAGPLLHEGLVDAAGLTIAIHIRSATLFQQGPARIISLSDGASHRNFTLGQQRDAAVIRVRTPATGPNGSDPQTAASGVIWPDQDVFLVATYDGRAFRIYADGALAAERRLPAGGFESWDPDHVLIYGNETTGDRAWTGHLYDAAVFNRALSAEEIAELSPLDLVSDLPGKLIRLADRCPAEQVMTETAGTCAIPARYQNSHQWDVLRTGMRAPSDYLINAALWAPAGILLALVAMASSIARTILIGGGLILLAAGIETGQASLFSRTSALHDMLASITGAGAAALWWIWWCRHRQPNRPTP
ncbi:MAG: LamG domain-containing protein [Pseudomonadota bacterium]